MIEKIDGDHIFLRTLDAVQEEWYEDDLTIHGAVRILTELADVLITCGWGPLTFHELEDGKVTGTSRQLADQALKQAGSRKRGT